MTFYDGTVSESEIPMKVRLHLAHGVLQALADRADARVLHIKGVALHPALSEGRRPSTDCDLLVAPEDVDTMITALENASWHRVTTFEHGSVFAHAATYYHSVWGTVDLHRWFPGLHRDASAAFDALWADHVLVDQGGRPTAVPSLIGQRLLLLVHAARTGGFGAAGDVERAWTQAPEVEKAEVEALAQQLDAVVPLAIATGREHEVFGLPQARLWMALHDHENSTAVWMARLQDARGPREAVSVLWAALHVNPDHLALRLGRTPTRADLARDWVDRFGRAGRRGVQAVSRRLRREPPAPG